MWCRRRLKAQRGQEENRMWNRATANNFRLQTQHNWKHAQIWSITHMFYFTKICQISSLIQMMEICQVQNQTWRQTKLYLMTGSHVFSLNNSKLGLDLFLKHFSQRETTIFQMEFSLKAACVCVSHQIQKVDHYMFDDIYACSHSRQEYWRRSTVLLSWNTKGG